MSSRHHVHPLARASVVGLWKSALCSLFESGLHPTNETQWSPLENVSVPANHQSMSLFDHAQGTPTAQVTNPPQFVDGSVEPSVRFSLRYVESTLDIS